MSTDQAMPFGEPLHCHRQSAGLSQEELAERAGLSPRGLTLHGGSSPMGSQASRLMG